MDIFEALKLLDEGVKIRDVKMPSGVYLEKVDGKIISSQGRQGVDLNTDAEYEIYEESKPKYIDEICILLEKLGQFTQEKCTYDCNKCELKMGNECYRDKLGNIAKHYNTFKTKMKIKEEIDEINKLCNYYEKQNPTSFIKMHIPNYKDGTFITASTKDIQPRVFDKLREQGFKVEVH